jgi:hypothetical protein
MAFRVALWVFLNPRGNALELGLDLDGIIFPIPKKSKKLSRLVFSFAPNYMNQNISNTKISCSRTRCKLRKIMFVV